MTCNHCAQEFDSSVTTCPNCGRTLVYGAAASVTTRGPADNPVMPPFNPVADPNVRPAPTLGATMSVTGSSSIRARLRPREIGEIFSEAFRLYGQNWKLYWGIVLLFYIPFGIITFLWQSVTFSPAGQADPTRLMTTLVPVMLIMYVPIFLVYFGLTRAVSDTYLGRTVRFSDVVTPNARFWAMVGANVLMGLVFVGLAIAFAVVLPIVVMLKISPAWLVVPGMVATVFAYVLLIHWSVSTSVAVIEGTGSRASLRRSAELVRGFGWKAFGILFGAGLLYFIAMGVVGAILSNALAPLFGGHTIGMFGIAAASATVTFAVDQLIQVLIAMVGLPIMLLPLVLFYYDLRVRKEAFDLQMLAEQLGYGYQEAGTELHPV